MKARLWRCYCAYSGSIRVPCLLVDDVDHHAKTHLTQLQPTQTHTSYHHVRPLNRVLSNHKHLPLLVFLLSNFRNRRVMRKENSRYCCAAVFCRMTISEKSNPPRMAIAVAIAQLFSDCARTSSASSPDELAQPFSSLRGFV